MNDRSASHSDSPRENPAGAGSKKRALHPLLRLGAWCFVGYVVFVLLMMVMENSLIYFPLRYPTGEWDPPGLVFEDVHFQAADGTQLHGWYVPAEDPRAYLLFSHGNAGNLTHRTPLLRKLHDRFNISVFIYDYRGYGKSEGRPTEAGVLKDARAAQSWLAERAGIDESQVVLMGRSLGAAVSVHLAAENGAQALILESGFTSLPDVAAYHYPWLPVRWLMRSRMDAEQQIVHYDGPLLQSHSEVDEIIPLELGKRLFEVAPGPKQFVLIEGAGHNDPQPPEYYEAFEQFLQELESAESR